MADKQNEPKKDDMRDKDLAAETRPVPSQAEGDEETIDEDLKRSEQK